MMFNAQLVQYRVRNIMQMFIRTVSLHNMVNTDNF